QDGEGSILEAGAAAVEVDLVEDLDLLRGEGDLDLVGAAVLVLEAVEGLGLERALVVLVGDLVAILVGAAFQGGGPRGQGAPVVAVGDAVLVVVGVGAAVLILEAVLVFGGGGALVGRAPDGVVVGVGVGLGGEGDPREEAHIGGAHPV